MKLPIFLFNCILFFTLSFLSIGYSQTCKSTSAPPSTPDVQLINNHDGTVSDRTTGLMWKKCVEGMYGTNCENGTESRVNWQKALETVSTVNDKGFAGYTDWRLPNIKELVSITERQCYDPALNLHFFPNGPSRAVWSSTPEAQHDDFAGLIDFKAGTQRFLNRQSGNYLVRLVRGGL